MWAGCQGQTPVPDHPAMGWEPDWNSRGRSRGLTLQIGTRVLGEGRGKRCTPQGCLSCSAPTYRPEPWAGEPSPRTLAGWRGAAVSSSPHASKSFYELRAGSQARLEQFAVIFFSPQMQKYLASGLSSSARQGAGDP